MIDTDLARPVYAPRLSLLHFDFYLERPSVAELDMNTARSGSELILQYLCMGQWNRLQQSVSILLGDIQKATSYALRSEEST